MWFWKKGETDRIGVSQKIFGFATLSFHAVEFCRYNPSSYGWHHAGCEFGLDLLQSHDINMNEIYKFNILLTVH